MVYLLFFLIINKKQPSPSVKPVTNQGSKLVAAFDIYVLHLFIMGLDGIFTQVFLAKLTDSYILGIRATSILDS